MAINIKPVSDLLDLEFVIPSYQRGYRWEEEQIIELLNDLSTFVKSAKDQNEFYCLQPVVVVEDSQKKGRYIVVDGQQRLTTLMLIIKNLGGSREQCFSLKFDKRDEQERFIESELYSKADDETYKDNIDNFYIRKAYDTISEWKRQNKNASIFVPTLLQPDPIKGYAAVIWHIIPEADAMKAFRRLNYGKIPLTPAELIKALLLQTDCYPDDEREKQQALAQRRSMEWDEMGHRLSNPLFSSMISRKDEEPEQGMDIVLGFVADKINEKLDKKFKRKKEGEKRRDNFAYHVIEQKIKEDIAANKTRQESVEQIWSEIQKTFNQLADWFTNREWYHLIGLWRILSKKQPAREFIADVMSKARNEDGNLTTKREFTENLRRHIGKSYIEVPEAKAKDGEPYPPQGLNSPELNYEGRHKSKMVNILIALNVFTTLNDPTGTAMFPFHLFQQYKPISLEHIHPQNITEKLSYKEASRWISDREADSREADDEAWARMAKSFSTNQAPTETSESDQPTEDDIRNARKIVADSIKALRELTESEKQFEENQEEVNHHLRVLDTMFGDMAGIDTDELHSISNMALVSRALNSALSNRHLDDKRRILLDYERLPRTDKNATYIPPCTLQVFAKHFSAGRPGNMKFWQPEDRKAYMERIQEVYDHFTH